MSLQVPMRRGRSLDFGAIKWVPDNPSRCKTKKLYGARELTNGGFRLSNANSCLSGLSDKSVISTLLIQCPLMGEPAGAHNDCV